MASIEKAISNFLDGERKEAEEASATERNQMSVDPNCYIAKEIKYQTALMHNILTQLREIKFEMERQGRLRPAKYSDQASLTAKIDS